MPPPPKLTRDLEYQTTRSPVALPVLDGSRTESRPSLLRHLFITERKSSWYNLRLGSEDGPRAGDVASRRTPTRHDRWTRRFPVVQFYGTNPRSLSLGTEEPETQPPPPHPVHLVSVEVTMSTRTRMGLNCVKEIIYKVNDTSEFC